MHHHGVKGVSQMFASKFSGYSHDWDLHSMVERSGVLEKKGYSVTWTSLQDDKPHCQGIIISLLDLYQMTPARCRMLQQLFNSLSQSKLFWVTHETQMGCQDPRFGLSPGFLRSLRQECEFDIIMFESDAFNIDTSIALVEVIEKASKLWDGSNRTAKDFEFAFHEGVVHMSRYHRLQPLEDRPEGLEQDYPLAFRLGTTLIYDPSRVSCCPRQLEEDQIEVDISYVALNFMVSRLSAQNIF
jgi:hypothetical protein